MHSTAVDRTPRSTAALNMIDIDILSCWGLRFDLLFFLVLSCFSTFSQKYFNFLKTPG